MNYTVLHGTTDPDLIFSFENNRAAYFTDFMSVAKYFATMEDFGGLLPGEVATIVHAKIQINNPLIIGDDEWEEVGDICYLDKSSIIKQGFDGIISKNSSNCTYYVAFHKHQVSILKREYI